MAEIGSIAERRPAVGVLCDGERMKVHAGKEGAAFLVLAARPLHEPIVQHGPFKISRN